MHQQSAVPPTLNSAGRLSSAKPEQRLTAALPVSSSKELRRSRTSALPALETLAPVATERSSRKRALPHVKDCHPPVPRRLKSHRQSLPSPKPSRAEEESEREDSSEENNENEQQQEPVNDQEQNEGGGGLNGLRILSPPFDSDVVSITAQLASNVDHRPDQANDTSAFEILRAYLSPESPAAFYRHVAAALTNQGQHMIPLAAPQLLNVFEEKQFLHGEHGDQQLLDTLAYLSNYMST